MVIQIHKRVRFVAKKVKATTNVTNRRVRVSGRIARVVIGEAAAFEVINGGDPYTEYSTEIIG